MYIVANNNIKNIHSQFTAAKVMQLHNIHSRTLRACLTTTTATALTVTCQPMFTIHQSWQVTNWLVGV